MDVSIVLKVRDTLDLKRMAFNKLPYTSVTIYHKHCHTKTHTPFNGHVPVKPGLAGCPLLLIRGALKPEVFTSWMPFLSPNQQCQCTSCRFRNRSTLGRTLSVTQSMADTKNESKLHYYNVTTTAIHRPARLQLT